MAKLYGFNRGTARTLQRFASNSGIVGRGRLKHAYPSFPSEYAGAMGIARVGDTEIPAATEAGGTRTAGKGDVTIHVIEDDDDLTAALDNAAAPIVVEAYNWSLTSFAVNSYVWVSMNTFDGKLNILGSTTASRERVGYLQSSVPHLTIGRVFLVLQVDTGAPGDPIAAPTATGEYVDAINITKFTMQAGTAADGPYMVVEEVENFAMPRMFPDQIELCSTPIYGSNSVN